MSLATIEVKKQQVDVVTEKFEQSVTAVVVDYRGLTVSEVTELRTQLRDEGVELKVIKNNISRRAAAKAGYETLATSLVGPSAIAFSEADAVAPARVLYKFSKDHQNLEIKGGYVEGKVLTVDELQELAKLPNRDGMLSMLLSVLQAPVRNFALAVKAVAEKDEVAEEAAE